MIHQVALILYLLLQKRRVICLHFLKIANPKPVYKRFGDRG